MKSFKEYVIATNEAKIDSIKMAIEQLEECFKDHKLYDPEKYELTYYSERNLYQLGFKRKEGGAFSSISYSNMMTLKEFECYLRGMVDVFFMKTPNF